MPSPSASAPSNQPMRLFMPSACLDINRSYGESPWDTSSTPVRSRHSLNERKRSPPLFVGMPSPTSVSTQGYPSGTAGLQAMQADLRDAYFKAYSELGFTGVARAGDGFLRAVDQGLADQSVTGA